jgi:hypothetical protein
MKDGRLNTRGSCAAMWVSPHHPPAEKRAYVMKRAGKRTVRPERVVFGGSVRILSGVAGALLGWAGGLPVSC